MRRMDKVARTHKVGSRTWLALSCATVLAFGTACGGSSPGSSDAASGAAGSALTKLKADKAITVGIVQQIPFGGISPDGGLEGVGPELTAKIMGGLGITKITPKSATYANMIPGLLAGRWDMVAATVIVTPERCQQVLMSEPFMSDFPIFAYKDGTPPASFKDVASSGIKMGILAGSSYIQAATGAGVGTGQIVQFQDIRSALDALLAGRVTVVAGSAAGFHITGIDSSIQFTERIAEVQPSVDAFAFRKDESDLRDAVNAQLGKLKDSGEYQTIAEKNGFTGHEIEGLSSEKACQP